ncbi:MAG: hypothetical protein BroJett018_25990 [Chloroflexota bacterium]|nr:MAG: hypothetical protein BroJett018_25990 [Chloroflexota bacterium]
MTEPQTTTTTSPKPLTETEVIVSGIEWDMRRISEGIEKLTAAIRELRQLIAKDLPVAPKNQETP